MLDVTLEENEASFHPIDRFVMPGRVPNRTAQRCANGDWATDHRPTDCGAYHYSDDDSGGLTHNSAYDCANRRADTVPSHISGYHVYDYATRHGDADAGPGSTCSERCGREC